MALGGFLRPGPFRVHDMTEVSPRARVASSHSLRRIGLLAPESSMQAAHTHVHRWHAHPAWPMLKSVTDGIWWAQVSSIGR
jgi:hypothetical protein